jgi:hypothetical protein
LPKQALFAYFGNLVVAGRDARGISTLIAGVWGADHSLDGANHLPPQDFCLSVC